MDNSTWIVVVVSLAAGIGALLMLVINVLRSSSDKSDRTLSDRLSQIEAQQMRQLERLEENQRAIWEWARSETRQIMQGQTDSFKAEANERMGSLDKRLLELRREVVHGLRTVDGYLVHLAEQIPSERYKIAESIRSRLEDGG